MLKFRNGDLFDSTAQTLVNTVNCRGVMGKGVALRFKHEFPQMFRDYVARCKARLLRPGEPYLFASNGRQIINFPTKDDWKRNSRLEYIESGLAALRANLTTWHVRSMAMPALGCGHGGLDWNDVRPLIERYLQDVDIDIEIFEPTARKDSGSFTARDHADRQPQFSTESAVVKKTVGNSSHTSDEQNLPLFDDRGDTDLRASRPKRRVKSTKYDMMCTSATVESISAPTGLHGNHEVKLSDRTILIVSGDNTEFLKTLSAGDELQACFSPDVSTTPRTPVYHPGLVVRVRDGVSAQTVGVPGINAGPVLKPKGNRGERKANSERTLT